MQRTQLTKTIIRQRKNSCMTFLNRCIVNCDEVHAQSCHEYCLHESDDVARQRAVDVCLYAFRKTLMQCHVSWPVVSACGCEFDHLKTSTHSSDICCNFWPEWESCRTSFAGDFSPIPGDIHYCVKEPESKGSRTSFAGGYYPIPDDMRVCFDSL